MSLEKTSCRSEWFLVLPAFHSECRSCWRSFSKLKHEEAGEPASSYLRGCMMAKTWNQTRVSETLGIEYPIIQGPLGGLLIAETYRRCIELRRTRILRRARP